MSKDIAAWAGVLLVEAAVLAWFGTASALACAIPLLVYTFADKPEISRILRKLRLTTGRAVVLAIAVAIGVVARDTWQHRYKPSMLKRLITLVEHDPGNWRNYATGERSIRLDESTHLLSTVGTIQRFNPRLQLPPDAENLSDVVVVVRFPREPFTSNPTAIKVPSPWQVAEGTLDTFAYTAEFGEIRTGSEQSPAEEPFLLGLIRACMKCRITYTITGKTETSGVLPINRMFYWDVVEATR